MSLFKKSPLKNPNGVPSYSPRLPEPARATLGMNTIKSPTPTGLPQFENQHESHHFLEKISTIDRNLIAKHLPDFSLTP
jgi:hypothetical protein